MVKWLLQNNANPHDKNSEGLLPFQGATLNGHLQCLQILLDAMKGQPDFNTKIYDENPLTWSIIGNNEEMLYFLLHQGAQISNEIKELAKIMGKQKINKSM